MGPRRAPRTGPLGDASPLLDGSRESPGPGLAGNGAPRALPHWRAMLSRATALEALVADPFDVLVSGAGSPVPGSRWTPPAAATASRWWRRPTSPRAPQPLLQARPRGLRYLQQFDLGLVREALLERSINVALAPHLVRPLKLVVAAFDGQRPTGCSGSG